MIPRVTQVARDRRGVVSVEYAVVIGALASAIAMAFSGLLAKLLVRLGGLAF